MIHSQIYTCTDQLPNNWDNLARQDLFLHTSYLKALEMALPLSMTLYYIGVYKKNILCGIAVVQCVKLSGKDMFRSTSETKLLALLKVVVTVILKGHILVVGNLTHTGQHGMCFDSKQIAQDLFLKTLLKAISELKNFIEQNEKKSIIGILLKDFFMDDKIQASSEIFKAQGFNKYEVQPNMVLEISTDWNHMGDYLNDLNKKYRSRYKRALKKLGIIEVTEMTADDIFQDSERLYYLYKNVSDKAAFNTFLLPEDHFYVFKKQLQKNFRVFAFYKEKEIVGFYTLLINGKTLETYFLGYDDSYQHKNQLYLNMLYEMLAFGISHGLDRIVFARTAMEIKSSVGARPKSMQMYVKHSNRLVNISLKPIFKLMNSEKRWDERNPFKITNVS